jgi:hypothetical protein
MKRFAAFVCILFLFVSCVPEKEVIQPQKETRVLPPTPEIKPVAPPSAKKYEKVLTCEERTEDFFNRSGIEVLPFVRLAFFDMDSDGREELIAGSKDGYLRLYKRISTGQSQKWEYVSNFFDGISVGAFASPAVGDIDQDGKPEIIVGTGGFSSDSGKVLVFRNSGSMSKPRWMKIDMPGIDVGDDAAPALVDANGDGKPDLVIGNSTGALFLYRNSSSRGSVSFGKDAEYFRGVSVGMYGMPAATVHSGKIIIIAGNSMGKLYLLERAQSGKSGWQKTTLKIGFSSFAAPSFLRDSSDPLPNLVVSDGNGQIHYFKNAGPGFREWNEGYTFFAGRIMPGPACTPSQADVKGRSCMITGNINGELKFFEFRPYAEILPWVERPDYFRGIKLSGFSRGVITSWQHKELLITGQQDGLIRAFVNTGTPERPAWKERKDFFRGVPKTLHASPTAFDIDGDGIWELITGDVEGYVRAYRADDPGAANPSWKKVENVFSSVRVERYASPSLTRDAERLYLFVGGQDGSISLYTAQNGRTPLFQRDRLFNGIQVKNHSAPSVYLRDGIIEMSVGDYNGNLRHFACRNSDTQIQER